ncbi:MAG: hypothetical protein M5R36_20450 [Deltaproteobacteria bacterium]|nr:hypothetical protein [Deltaproteobacteria bacterium]
MNIQNQPELRPHRVIMHMDMDAFFAAIEQRDDPSLRGKPVIVGARPGGRGVVSTASYEARQFGVRSAMPISEAERRCPQGIFVRPSYQKYADALPCRPRDPRADFAPRPNGVHR